MTDMNKLKGKLREKGLTYEDGASVIGVSKPTFNSRISGKSGFGVVEAKKLSDELELTNEEAFSIFFA